MSLEQWLNLHFDGSPDGSIKVKYWKVKAQFKRKLTRREQRYILSLLEDIGYGWVGQDGILIDCTEKRPCGDWARWFVRCANVAPISEVLITPLQFYSPLPYEVDVPLCLWIDNEHFTNPDWTEWFDLGMKQKSKES